MIKIQHPNLNTIALNYFEKVKTSCLEMSSFILTILNVLRNNADTGQIKDHSLHGSKKRTFVIKILNVNITGQNNYHLVNSTNVDQLFMSEINGIHSMVSYFNDYNNLKELILVKPKDAIKLNSQLKVQFGITAFNEITYTKIINEIINYTFFSDCAYEVASSLGLSTCPYCNRNFIHTIIKEKGILRPTFDHFFSQFDHPLLSLSFYNLIPSCYNCNSNLKGSIKTTLDTHLHPYLDGFDQDATFFVLFKDLLPNKSDPKNFRLILINNQFPLGLKYRRIFGLTNSEGNINLFRILEIYQAHLDVVGELIVKCDRLNKSYSNSLSSLFVGLKTNQSEFYNFYFGNYFNEKDFHRRPLAKMTKDVINQAMPFF